MAEHTVVKIRDERPGDHASVRRVNETAFGQCDEADIVDRLREAARPLVSRVATRRDQIVGHILFSPVRLENHPDVLVMGLAPMAVAPEQQNRGIGSALVDDGLAKCREIGAAAVVVLGHAGYYPRFGFVPASRFGITCQWDVPDEAFMAVALRDQALDGLGGIARYHPALEG